MSVDEGNFNEVLDSVCDRFEAAWGTVDMPPRIDRFVVCNLPAHNRLKLLTELAFIDIERRWRAFFGKQASIARMDRRDADILPELPSVENYVGLFPELAPESASMLVHEFTVRQRFGDRPHIDTFLERCPELCAEAEGILREQAANLAYAILKVFQNEEVAFACALPGRLLIGRQKQQEEPPIRLATCPTGMRLIIAPASEAAISREQLKIDVVNCDRLRIVNTANAGSLAVYNVGSLAPGESCEVAFPCRLLFPGRCVVVEQPV